MVRVALGIGSNLNRRRHIQAATRALEREFGTVRLSPVYRTRAVGFEGPDFFNLVALIETDLAIDELHDRLRHIEDSQGRQRGGERFASRSLDIDILLYGDAVLHDIGYDVPRDEILRYAFVLKPLADLMPDQRHPENGEEYVTLWLRFHETHCVDYMVDCDWLPDLERHGD